MKRKISLIASLVFAVCCLFAISVSATCEGGCVDGWSVALGDDGYLGSAYATNTCPTCGEQIAVEEIDPLFVTLGYSYGDNGITQHYGVNREALARYEELSGNTVRFGVIMAISSNLTGAPVDSEGNFAEGVSYTELTNLDYSVFDVMVNNIPDQYKESTEIISCAYVLAGGKVTYLVNGLEMYQYTNIGDTFNDVKEKVDGVATINGKEYKVLSAQDIGLSVGGYYNSSYNDPSGNYQLVTNTVTGKDLAAQYAYTKLLTRSDIPNGTIIELASGWTYRPEGWENAALNTNRPGEVTAASVTVDSAWWGSYTERAFNIKKSGNYLTGNYAKGDIDEIFTIYAPIIKETHWSDDGSLKILTIGNSYSDDAMEYVYYIAKSLGVEDVEVANLRYNSCSLAMHLDNAKNDKGVYMYRHWANGADKWVDQGSWASNGTYKISQAVTNADWDFIVFQQVSTSSTNANTYDDLNELIGIVRELNSTAKIAWHMTWGNKTTTDLSMYNGIVSAVQNKIVPNENVDIIIPVGTTIQNARATSVSLNALMRNNHLGYGLGRYAAGLTFVSKLTGLSIDNIEYVPTKDTEGHTITISDEEKSIVIEAVKNAIENPFSVTEN